MSVDSSVIASLLAHRTTRSLDSRHIMSFKGSLLCCGALMLLPFGIARSLRDSASPSQTSDATATGSSSISDKLVCNSVLVPQLSLVDGPTTQGMEDARVFREDRGIAFQAYIAEELENMNKLQIAENDNRTHIRAVMSALFSSNQTLTENYTILVPPTADIEVLQHLDDLGRDMAPPDESTPLHILPGRWTVEDLLNNAVLNRTVETLQGASLQLIYSSEDYVQPSMDDIIRPGHVHLPTRLNFTHLLSTANLHAQEIESCKPGSMILQINAILTEGLSIESLRTIVAAVHDPKDSNSNSDDSDASDGSPSTFVCTRVSGNWVECKARNSDEKNSGRFSRNIGVSPNSDRHSHGQFLPLSLTVLCCVAFLVGFYVVRKLRGGSEEEAGRGRGRRGAAREAHMQELAASVGPTIRVEEMSSAELEKLVPGAKLTRLGVTRWKTTPVETSTPVDTSETPMDTSGTPVDTVASGAPVGTALPFQEPTTNACAASVAVSQEEGNADSNSSLNLNANSNGLKENTSSDKVVTCVICMEAQGDHVLLPCGHGGYCHACAHQLLARKSPARMCPMCRATLTAAVQVVMHTAVGEEGVVQRGIHVNSEHCEGASDKRVR